VQTHTETLDLTLAKLSGQRQKNKKQNKTNKLWFAGFAGD